MTFVRNSSGSSYHLNLTVPSLSVPGYGTWPCPPSACEQGGNCAPGCVGENTVSATAKFGGVGGAHGTAGAIAQQTAPPATYINIQATEEATFCDVFYIEDGYSQECEAVGNGTALDGVGRELASLGVSFNLKVGMATTGAKWLGAGQSGTGLAGAVYCNVSEYCSASTTPPLCSVKSPVYLNTFGQTGTPDQLCAIRGAWTEEIPYVTYTLSSGSQVTLCSPVQDTAIPLGPAAPALSCTTQP
jgi:hypothetical protein